MPRINDRYSSRLVNLSRKHFNDVPDVEFNDDGSVRVNTPGDYFVSTDDNGHAWYVFVRYDNGRTKSYYREDPALD